MARGSGEIKQRPLVVDSVSARREFTQCQNCFKSKDKHKVKLSLCTGCHVATYCSAACQRAHWPKHKAVCLHRREQERHFKELDQEALGNPTIPPTMQFPDGIRIQPAAATPSLPHPEGSAPLLPSDLYNEIRAFTKKFNPALFQAGFNCLHLARAPTISDAAAFARRSVVLVILTRLPASSLPANSRPWARFTLDFVGDVPTTFIAQRLGGTKADGRKFLEMKAEQEKQHIANGNAGTITTLISAACEGGPVLHNVASIGFGAHSQEALQIEDNWEETLRHTIERMCRRLPSEQDE